MLSTNTPKIRITFYGLGSIGRRHAKLIHQHYPYFKLTAYRTQKRYPSPSYIQDVDDISGDIAFICNPTHLHIKTAIQCAQKKMAIFLEKPIDIDTHKLTDLISLIQKNNLTTYIAYPFRHNPIITKLQTDLENKKVYHARFVCSSYLPDWRSGDHLKNYSAHKNQGGGPLLDLSHEIDCAVFLFGPIAKIICKHGKLADVTVDADDCADLIIIHKSGVVNNIHLDLFARKAERYITVQTKKKTCHVNLINKKATEQSYVNQLKYFFDNIDNPRMDNNIIEASGLFREIVNL